jgi:hypothetical protein
MAQIDQYTKDAREWRKYAEYAYDGAILLFDSPNPFVWFSAAMLGHHALEMLLKSALICAGCPIVEKGKPEDGSVWGHDLEKLAALLASKRPHFSLQIRTRWGIPLLSCKTYLGRYNAFFEELRYPRTAPNVDSLGPGCDEAELLTELMDGIRPFAFPSAEEVEAV